MDVSEFLTAFADYGFEDSSTTTKVRALQGAIRELERRRPWPFLQTSITLTFNGSSDVATNLPSNLRAVLRMKDLQTGRRVRHLRLDDFEDVVGKDYSRAGAPLFYYFEGTQLRVWPIPPASTTLKTRYLQRSADITSGTLEADILIPAAYHETLLFAGVMRLADMEDDPEVAQRVEALYRASLEEMVEDAFRQQYDEQDYIHVIDPDDVYSDER